MTGMMPLWAINKTKTREDSVRESSLVSCKRLGRGRRIQRRGVLFIWLLPCFTACFLVMPG